MYLLCKENQHKGGGSVTTDHLLLLGGTNSLVVCDPAKGKIPALTSGSELWPEVQIGAVLSQRF